MLKPCAHCGSPARFDSLQSGANSRDRAKVIMCSNEKCAMMTQIAVADNVEAVQEIMDIWNRRSTGFVMPPSSAGMLMDLSFLGKLDQPAPSRPKLTLVVNR